jgi:EAL and modified HD-GYP domain-containing signal transduction protein
MQNIFIGRQAIFDRQMEVYGYELLYREGDTEGVQVSDGDLASSRVMLNAFMDIGLECLVGPHHAFINLTRNFFADSPSIPFEQGQVVLELLEDLAVDEHLIQSVASLASQGYSLALDDYEFDPRWDPLLPYISIIKVEVPAVCPDTQRDKIQSLQQQGIRLLAEKVETEEEYRLYHDLGFDYFQGYFFSRPKTVKGRRLGENQLVIMQLLARLNDPDIGVSELERLISQDVALSYKILKYINSAAMALPRKLDSIGQAVVYLGLQRIKAWANLIALSRVENKPQEILYTALVRANMCQQLIQRSGQHNAETAFTVGLLSTLDLLLDSPLAEVLKELPLSDEIHAALLGKSGPIGEALACTLAYEFQNWEQTSFNGLDNTTICEIYLSSTQKAFEFHEVLGG